MRVDLVSEHASPLAAIGGVDAGGQNVHVAALAAGLARRGHEVTVHTRRDDASLPERVVLQDGYEVVHVTAGPVRAMAAHHDGGSETPAPELETAAAALPLRVSFAGRQPHLEPVPTGVRGALARLLIAVDDCRLDGTWSRLKICPADDCRWAFYDESKNRTRVWCAMGVCGNRRKTRAYRARRRRAHEG